jgi:hypothetical protein
MVIEMGLGVANGERRASTPFVIFSPETGPVYQICVSQSLELGLLLFFLLLLLRREDILPLRRS